jgi:hypothetical protein
MLQYSMHKPRGVRLDLRINFSRPPDDAGHGRHHMHSFVATLALTLTVLVTLGFRAGVLGPEATCREPFLGADKAMRAPARATSSVSPFRREAKCIG